MRDFVKDIGIENLGKRLVNSKEGAVEFERPPMNVDILMKCTSQPPVSAWLHFVSISPDCKAANTAFCSFFCPHLVSFMQQLRNGA